MQFIWETIEGLYFPYAYHAIIIPLILYVLHEIKIHSFDKKINALKLSLIGASFGLLFTPAFHLFFSGQLTLHEMIFSTFNPGLDHMPFSEYLPFICLLMIILPIKNKSEKDEVAKT